MLTRSAGQAARVESSSSAARVNEADDEEEENDDSDCELSLEDFVASHSLPQRAKVTQGYYDPYNPDNEFSTNDVIEVIWLVGCLFT